MHLRRLLSSVALSTPLLLAQAGPLQAQGEADTTGKPSATHEKAPVKRLSRRTAKSVMLAKPCRCVPGNSKQPHYDDAVACARTDAS
jgi:hypothetical protein